MKHLYKIAANLKLKGFDKLAGDVIDLLQKRKDKDKRTEHNQAILDDMNEEDRMYGLLGEHDQDKRNFQMTTPELSYPGSENGSRRFEVKVSYPSFDDQGAPYFGEDSVTETLSMTEEELESHRQQEQQGYIKIHSAEPSIPTM